MYYESHVTIEPVFDDRLEEATKIALNHGFKIANLLMQKREADQPERSKHDTFMTRHAPSTIDGLLDIKSRTCMLVVDLQANGFKVWRYKLERAIFDSRIEDTWELLK